MSYFNNKPKKMKGLIGIILLLSCTIEGYTQKVSTPEDKPTHFIFSIYFGGGSFYIDEGQIQDFKDWLNQFPTLEGYEISVHGHTDNIGSKSYNDWLSQMRTEGVIELLAKHGFDVGAISIEDFGELNPIYDNSTHEGRLKNRRADVIIKPIVQ